MTIKVAINGLGRIGKGVLRASQNRNDIEIVAINDLLDIKYISYILKYDSTHGNFKKKILINKNTIIVNNKKIKYFSEKNILKLPWKEMKIDVVVESTGLFLTDKDSRKHITAGAKKVILTGPSKDCTPMFVMGVNHYKYNGEDIISNASCTTNCLAPLALIIHNKFKIIEGLMTTVHSATSTQKIVDGSSSKDWRSGRSALQNIIPSSTGAANAVGKVIPELNNKLTGIAFRVPTPNVSVVDLTVKLKYNVTYEEICQTIKIASENEFYGIMGYTEENVVSSDFNGNSLISIFDANAGVSLNNRFTKLIAWYDNETGYSHKILDTIAYIFNK